LLHPASRMFSCASSHLRHIYTYTRTLGACIHVCMSMCMCVYVCARVYVCVMCVLCVCVCVDLYTCVSIYNAHTHIHTHTYTHTYTHIYIYIYIYIQTSMKRQNNKNNPSLTDHQLTPDPHESLASLAPRHEAYLAEAQRLQAKYADKIHILIGFEGEWIRSSYESIVTSLAAASPSIDYFIGSVHHAGGIPIDFDKAMYATARDACGGTEAAMYASYYDAQFDMLQALRPRVVGHFDLIRLMSDDPARDLRGWEGGHVWQKVLRNLRFVVQYGGWLECNTSALRKGLAEPYPARQIAQVSVYREDIYCFSFFSFFSFFSLSHLREK
jgi:HisJ family histidinol phosphate phosphatase